MKFFWRFRCHLFGCDSEYSSWQACARCGTDIYGDDFVQSGLLAPLFRLRERIKSRFGKPPACSTCGAAMKRKYYEGSVYFECPNEADDNHLPF